MRALYQCLNYRGGDIDERSNARGDVLTRRTERKCTYRIKCVAAGREIYDVSVIARNNYRYPRKIRSFEDCSNKPTKLGKVLEGEIAPLGVTNPVGDEVLVQS